MFKILPNKLEFKIFNNVCINQLKEFNKQKLNTFTIIEISENWKKGWERKKKCLLMNETYFITF